MKFNEVNYVGNGSDSFINHGLDNGLPPDFVWVKQRPSPIQDIIKARHAEIIDHLKNKYPQEFK